MAELYIIADITMNEFKVHKKTFTEAWPHQGGLRLSDTACGQSGVFLLKPLKHSISVRYCSTCGTRGISTAYLPVFEEDRQDFSQVEHVAGC